MRRFGLRARFLTLLVCVLVSVFAAVTYVVARQNTATLRENLTTQSISFAELATTPIGDAYSLYKDGGTVRIEQEIKHFLNLNPNVHRVAIVDIEGNELFAIGSDIAIPVTRKQAESYEQTKIFDHNNNLIAVVQPYIEDYGIHQYSMVYGISYESIEASVRTTVLLILIISTGILLVLILVTYALMDYFFLQPLHYVSRAALHISKGHLEEQIRLSRKDEIGDLAQAVNVMADSLKADIAKLKAVDELKNEFLVITSHNLRTPLTVIRSYIDTIDQMETNEDLKKLIQPIKLSAMRLNGFAEDVLTISTFEAGENILRPEPTEMKPVLQQIVQDFEILAQEKQLQFIANIDTDAWVNLSKPHFRSALWNLLDNAYKFTAKNGSVTLTANTSDNKLHISVIDTGTGIPASEIPKLFTKFHRANDVMVYNYEGTGIGLYLAKIIINNHGGTITVDSTEGKGSTFTISLPTIAAPDDSK